MTDWATANKCAKESLHYRGPLPWYPLILPFRDGNCSLLSLRYRPRRLGGVPWARKTNSNSVSLPPHRGQVSGGRHGSRTRSSPFRKLTYARLSSPDT